MNLMNKTRMSSIEKVAFVGSSYGSALATLHKEDNKVSFKSPKLPPTYEWVIVGVVVFIAVVDQVRYLLS
jgi:hypothetical protein